MSIRGLDARIELAKSRIYQVIGLDSLADEMFTEALMSAYGDGYSDYHAGLSMSRLFVGESLLTSQYKDGKAFAGACDVYEGTRAEWDALTTDKQDAQWDTFHSLNAMGVADDMYFYRVLMDMHLVGYVGD